MNDQQKYIDLINKGATLQAIKAYQEDQGCSLKEAKEHIESLRGETAESNAANKKGCMITLLLISSTLAVCASLLITIAM